ncbi:monoheme cytochrome C [Flagellimonas sp. HMM57]|uniref:monoheme cytochrome C n=1 Tax=unclassified Flagellimonas TaxID=2644544 RepID=UPI0013D4E686|nr:MULTISPECIES: monoheme cytochrome C [unclassified Flagellimonas]UII74615.1 monoheme cytochrome C [Flagellimonas sp. HMM57]
MSSENEFKKQVKDLYQKILIAFGMIGIAVFGFLYIALNPSVFSKKPEETVVEVPETNNEIESGIHVDTGFVDGDGLTEVIQNCTNCHSAKLVTQNRMSKEGWIATIRWMQETQNLWDLGDQEKKIVNYLATNYAPQKKGRREALTNIEWYVLKQ